MGQKYRLWQYVKIEFLKEDKTGEEYPPGIWLVPPDFADKAFGYLRAGMFVPEGTTTIAYQGERLPVEVRG